MKKDIAEYIAEQNRVRDKKLKYDFMPSILEIIEKPANAWGSIIIAGLFVILISALLWSAVAKLDVVVTSSGVTIPEGNLNIVQSYAGGIVKNIHVQSGDYVEAGAVLAELVSDENDIDQSSLVTEYEMLKEMYDTEKMIYEGTDVEEIVIDSESPNKYRLQYIVIKEQMNQKQMKEAAGIQKEYLKQQRDASLLEDMNSISSRIAEVEATLDKIKLNEEYLSITAQASGYINELKINTIGQAVNAAQEIATIVPDNSETIFRGYIMSKDIADLKIGQEVRMKLDAYPYSEYGIIAGSVLSISPSSVYQENMGNVYIVEFSVSKENPLVHLIPGMNGTAEIKIGKRSVLQYFLEPITDGLHNSLKEK